MKKFNLFRSVILAAFLSGNLLSSCSLSEPEKLPQPITAPLTVSAARQWYETTGVSTPAAAAQGNKSAAATHSLNLDWTHAVAGKLEAEELVLVPVTEKQELFSGSAYRGYRYMLVTRKPNAAINGFIVEVLWQGKDRSAAEVSAMVRELYARQAKSAASAPADFTGYVFFYSPSYKYITGWKYAANATPARARLRFKQKATTSGASKAHQQRTLTIWETCTDWYNVYSGEYINTTCTYASIPDPDGTPAPPSGPGPGEWGGPENPNGGGGDGTILVPIVTIDASRLAPCAAKLVTDLRGLANNSSQQGGPIADLINKIGGNPIVHVTFDQAPNLRHNGKVVGALTSYTSGTNSYTITLNADHLQANSTYTNLAVASDVVHEFLHVYMLSWKDDHPELKGDGSLDAIMQQWFAKNAKYTTEQQHETMVQFTLLMGEAIQAYYGSTNSSSADAAYFSNLAWNGLFNTDAYKYMLSTADPARANLIMAIHAAEFNGTAGETMPSSTGSITVPNPKGVQLCP